MAKEYVVWLRSAEVSCVAGIARKGEPIECESSQLKGLLEAGFKKASKKEIEEHKKRKKKTNKDGEV